MLERLKVGLIIAGIYVLFILYLLFVSYRVEMLDHESNNISNSNIAVKLNQK